MRFKLDFVTNSSSSSFICDVCGRVEGGFDYSVEDADMYECENGHTFCQDEAVGIVGEYAKEEFMEVLKSRRDFYKLKKGDYYDQFVNRISHLIYKLDEATSRGDIEEVIEKGTDYLYNDEGYVPSYNCPICNLKNLKDSETIRYLFKKYNINEAGLLKEIKDAFESYKNFRKYIKK